MLGNLYIFYKDCCCGYVQSKMELTKIKLGAKAGVIQQNQTQEIIQAPQTSDLFSFGTWYRNTYSYYCGCCPYKVIYGNQVELNNQRIIATKEPTFCTQCGPFTVEDKMNFPIGELVPHCYSCNRMFCAYLQVKNSSMATVYKVKKIPCTWNPTWEILDPFETKKGEIRLSGCFCPDLEIDLPPDHQNHRKLLLATISYLP